MRSKVRFLVWYLNFWDDFNRWSSFLVFSIVGPKEMPFANYTETLDNHKQQCQTPNTIYFPLRFISLSTDSAPENGVFMSVGQVL